MTLGLACESTEEELLSESIHDAGAGGYESAIEDEARSPVRRWVIEIRQRA